MKRTLYILILFLIGFSAIGQVNITSFHMRDNSLLTQDLNPSFFPNTKFYFMFPGIGNANADINLPVAYNDIFEVTGDSVKVKLDSYLQTAGHDFISVKSHLPLFGMGLRVGNSGAATLFVNARNSFLFGIPKEAARFAWNGNGEYLGEEYVVDDLALGGMSYAEIGVGYSTELTIANQPFRIGGRVKYLLGAGMMGLDQNANVSIFTNEDSYETSFTFHNATLRLAGIDTDSDDNIDEGIIGGESSGGGLGFDIGAQYYFSDRWNFNFAMTDIGYISWKKSAKEIYIEDQTITFEGADVTADNYSDNFGEQFKDIFEADTISTEFTTALNPRMIMGSSYHITEKGTASASLSQTIEFGQLRTAIGVGYTHQFGRVLALTGTFSKTPQQPVDFGAGMMVNMGVMRLHLIGDGLFNYIDLTETKRVNFSFGLNVAIGNPNKARKSKSSKSEKIKPEKKSKKQEKLDQIQQMIDDLENSDGTDG